MPKLSSIYLYQSFSFSISDICHPCCCYDYLSYYHILCLLVTSCVQHQFGMDDISPYIWSLASGQHCLSLYHGSVHPSRNTPCSGMYLFYYLTSIDKGCLAVLFIQFITLLVRPFLFFDQAYVLAIQ